MERDHLYDPAPAGCPRRQPAPFAGEPWPGSDPSQRHLPIRCFRSTRPRNPRPQRSQRRQNLALAGLLASAALVSAACTGNHRPASPATGAGGTFSRGTASWYGPKFNGRRTASGERYDMHALTAAHPSLPFGTLLQVTNVENGRQVVVRINDRGPFGRRRIIDLSYAAARQLAMIGPGTAEVELAMLNRAEPAPTPAMQPILLAAVRPSDLLGAAEAGSEADAGSPPPPGARSDPTAAASELPARPLVGATAAASSPDAGTAADHAQPPPASAAPRSTGRAAYGMPPAHYTVQVGAFGEVERADALQQNLARLYPEAVVHSDGIWHRVQVGLFGDREVAEGLRRELAALGLEAVVIAAR
jgi:rare lipoprotein A